MGFKGLFKKAKAPTNKGKSEENGKFNSQWETIFFLELTNLEGRPTYELKHQLSVGSEIGNIVIDDPSLSPRHCTFYLQQDVISVVDHGSIQGTAINGKKLAPGKVVILEDMDKINVGDLEIGIIKQSREIEVPPAPIEKIAETATKEELEEVEQTLEVKIAETKTGKLKNKSLKSNSKKKTDHKANDSMSFKGVEPAANTLPRFFAIICDFLIAASLHMILLPFDDYKAYQEFVPGIINDVFGQDMGLLWDTFLQDWRAFAQLSEDLVSEINKAFPFVAITINFFVLRFISTLVFGVSLSEGCLGLKALGHAGWNRIGGAIRVIIGMITGPFIVFDIPALISRRTFKEFLTFTHIALRGKWLTSFLIILYFPFCIALFFVSPVFQGLDIPTPIYLVEGMQKTMPTVADPTIVMTKMRSHVLGFDLEVDPGQVKTFVDLKFQSLNKRKLAIPRIEFYLSALDRSIGLSIEKKFSMYELVLLGIKGNYFLHEKYPQLSKYIFNASNVNKNFHSVTSPGEELQFSNELADLLRIAFELSPENFTDVMLSHTFILKNLIEFKHSVLAMVDPGHTSVDLFKWGNQLSLRFSYVTGKTAYDLLVPLRRGPGVVYKISFDKPSELKDLKNSFYKIQVGDIDWRMKNTDEEYGAAETNAFKTFDFISSFGHAKSFEDNDFANMYGHYYQVAKELLSNPELKPELHAEYSQVLVRVYDALKFYIGNPAYEKNQNSLITLDKSFQDLMNAFNEKNMSFFETI